MKVRKRADSIADGVKTILTNDPSFTAWGWSVISFDGTVVKTGCIKTEPEHKKLRIRKGDDNVRRINEIASTLNNIMNEYNVNYVLSELPHGSQNANAATMIGAVIGILESICVVKGLGVEWYAESDSKKMLLGKEAATKTEMVDAVLRKFPKLKISNTKYIREAVADSLAIYVVAEQQSNAIKLFKTMK